VNKGGEVVRNYNTYRPFAIEEKGPIFTLYYTPSNREEWEMLCLLGWIGVLHIRNYVWHL
jgi:hypothetical protein